jgi:hypothetical protein
MADGASMRVRGGAAAGGGRQFLWRWPVAYLGSLALIISLSNRTFDFSNTTNTTVSPNSPIAKIQHMDKDAARWLRPASKWVPLAPSSHNEVTGDIQSSLVSQQVDLWFNNRPPPIVWKFY